MTTLKFQLLNENLFFRWKNYILKLMMIMILLDCGCDFKQYPKGSIEMVFQIKINNEN